MGHAGAVISGTRGTAAGKIKALTEAGVIEIDSPADMGKTVAQALVSTMG